MTDIEIDDETVEAAAKAMCEAEGQNPNRLIYHFNGEIQEPWGEAWQANINMARAAIAAAVAKEREKDSSALADVRAERERQMSVEGWTPEHDDRHESKELALAAAVYALHAAQPPKMIFSAELAEEVPENWPWAKCYFKPRGPRRDLVRAGALILAEIERLDRAAIRSAQEPRARIEQDNSHG